MAKFEIRYGLGGGFGGARNSDIIECKNLREAEQEAFLLACEQYDSYAGYHGLRDVSDIMNEDDVDEDEAWKIYGEERESWLDYYAEEFL